MSRLSREVRFEMIVCLCEGVSEREVKAAIQSGAECLDSVGRKCGAGTCCGGCTDLIKQMLGDKGVHQHHKDVAPRPSTTRIVG